MRILIAALILAWCGLAQLQPLPSSVERQQKTDAAKPTEKAPSGPMRYTTENNPQNDKEPSGIASIGAATVKAWDKFLTDPVQWFTLVLAVYTWRLYLATKGMLSVEAPRILITKSNITDLGPFVDVNGDKSRAFKCEVLFRNCGRSPAVMRDVRIALCPFRTLPRSTSKFFSTKETSIQDLLYTMNPDAMNDSYKAEFRLPTLDSFRVDEGGFIVAVQIRYEDVNGDLHITRQARHIHDSGLRSERIGGRRYNCYT